MKIEFRQITGPKGSKQDNFSLMCCRLLLKEFPDVRPVEGKGGDQGLDSFIGEIGQELRVFQFKFFCEGIRTNQKRQIRSSLKVAIEHHKVRSWTLIVPIDLNIQQQRWFAGLKKEYASLQIDWKGETWLLNLLAKHREIADDFFELPDARELREIISKQDAIIVSLAQLQTNVEGSDQKLAKLVDVVGDVLQVKPTATNRYHEKYVESVIHDLILRSRLCVLVWGPGKESEIDLYRKRLDIKEKLQQLGHQADFSEDILTSEMLNAGGINLSVAELLQAKGYEYIVCIMGSPGSVGEVHDFCHIPEIAHKMTICINEKHTAGYSGQGVLRIFEGNHGHLEKFKFPEDIANCRLLTNVVNQVENRAAAKQDQIARSAKAI